jgi:hypothetical protein
MNFLTPLFLTLSALAIPIFILYMLKLRRREQEVSSTFLWQMVVRDREANSPWQKLRRNLLLLLQLLLLALLVLALARPFIPVAVVASGQVTVLLDASASMNATDVSPSRFEAAKTMARSLANDLTDQGAMTIILVTPKPRVLISSSNDKLELLNAINAAQVTLGEADWATAFALAAGANGNAASATTVIISDGGLPANAPPLNGEVRYVPIGSQAANVGISTLSLRPLADGPQVFASLTNYGDAATAVILTLKVNGQLFQAQEVNVLAGKTANVIVNAPKETQVIEAELSAPVGVTRQDYFPADDKAWAVYNPPQAGRVLFLSEKGNLYIEQLLASLPGITPFRAPIDQPLPTDPFDLYIYDGVITGTLPTKNLLLINPPPNSLFEVRGAFTPTASSTVNVVVDPLTNFVDFNSVHILRARNVSVPAWAKMLISVEGKPLLFAGTLDRRRVGVITFDLRDSDLPLQITYPILMSNLMEWLTPSSVITTNGIVRPGDTVSIRPKEGEQAAGIVRPDGKVFVAQAGGQYVTFADTDVLGLYSVGTANIQDGTKLVGYFAVNLFDAHESNIRPVEKLSIGRTQISAAAREQFGQREFWSYLALAALVLMLLEWWVYHRGSVVPRLRKV